MCEHMLNENVLLVRGVTQWTFKRASFKISGSPFH